MLLKIYRLIVQVGICAALAQAQDATKPTDWQGWMAKGGEDFRSARYSEAIAAFQQAVDLNPEYAAARLALASAYMAEYDPASAAPQNVALAERARAEFSHVLETSPGNTKALRSLGTLSLQEAQEMQGTKQLNKLDDARDWFQRVLESEPQARDAFYSLGLIDWLRFSRPWQDARAEAGLKSDEAGPLPDAGVRNGLIAKYGGAMDSAVTNLHQALEIDPNYAEAMQIMGWVMRVRADLDDSPALYKADMGQAKQWAAKAAAAQGSRNPERLRVRGEIQATKLTSKAEPVYPPAARQAGIQGTVQFRVIVDQTGHVSSSQFVSGPEPLAAAAQDAVRRYVYQPTLFNGQAVEVITYIDVAFTLH